ncbi:MAG: MFS transporter [Phycisphaerales bacterium]|nr:MFS transporter [Phycisphaerales bacterium]
MPSYKTDTLPDLKTQTSSPPIDPWIDYTVIPQSASDRQGLSWSILVPVALLFFAAMPDAMFAPILKQIFIDRFQISDSAAHLFMAVNIIGVIGGVAALKWLRGFMKPMAILLLAALIEAVLFLVMGLLTAIPISFSALLLVRVVEGSTDLILLAVPLTIIANQMGGNRKTQGFGLGATTIILALSVGAFVGGYIASSAVFVWAAALTMVIAIIALMHIRSSSIATNPLTTDSKKQSSRNRISKRAYCGAWLLASDRALAALLATTVPIALATAGIQPATSGIAIGLCLLIMAIGSWPAGWLADQTSPRQIRIVFSITYACGFLLLAIGPLQEPGWLFFSFVIIGIGAAGLMPTALSLGSDRHASTSEVAAMQGASQIGYTIAVLAAAALLLATTGLMAYKMILFIAIGVFLVINLAAMNALKRINAKQATNDKSTTATSQESSYTSFSFEPLDEAIFFEAHDHDKDSRHVEIETRQVNRFKPETPVPASNP